MGSRGTLAALTATLKQCRQVDSFLYRRVAPDGRRCIYEAYEPCGDRRYAIVRQEGGEMLGRIGADLLTVKALETSLMTEISRAHALIERAFPEAAGGEARADRLLAVPPELHRLLAARELAEAARVAAEAEITNIDAEIGGLECFVVEKNLT